MNTQVNTLDANKSLIAIFLVVLIDVLGMTIMLPLLPFYSEHFGASAFVVGTLVSSYALCQLISGPILGNWSDKYGRKRILVLSQIGTFIGFLTLGSAQSLLWIFISRIIDGLTAGNISTAQAFIADVTPPKDRAKAMGKISIAFGIGFFIGPALTAFLFHYGYRVPIFVAAGLSFTSIFASYFLLPDTKHLLEEERKRNPPSETDAKFTMLKYFKQPVLAILLLEIFLFYFAFSAYMSGFALFAERRFSFNGIPLNPKQVGYAFTYFGLLGIIIQAFFIGRLVNKFGERRITWFGFLSAGIGYLLLAFIREPVMIAITGIFTSFGAGVLRPVLISEISSQVDPRERGRVIGTNQALQSVAQIIAPLISTAIITEKYLSAWAIFPACISFIGFALVTYHLSQKSLYEAH